jgi:hypothetical protein
MARGSLGVHAERCSSEPWPRSGVLSNRPDVGAVAIRAHRLLQRSAENGSRPGAHQGPGGVRRVPGSGENPHPRRSRREVQERNARASKRCHARGCRGADRWTHRIAERCPLGPWPGSGLRSDLSWCRRCGNLREGRASEMRRPSQPPPRLGILPLGLLTLPRAVGARSAAGAVTPFPCGATVSAPRGFPAATPREPTAENARPAPRTSVPQTVGGPWDSHCVRLAADVGAHLQDALGHTLTCFLGAGPV